MSGFAGLMASYKISPAAAYVTTGLILNFDAGNSASYPGTGTTWTSTVGSYTGTMGAGVTYSASNGGVMTFNGGTSAAVTFSGYTAPSNNFTAECWYQVNQVSSKYQPALFNEGSLGGAGFMMGYYSGASPANSWKLTKYGVVDIYIGSIPQNTGWHQVTYTYSSTSGVVVYVDGVSNGTSVNTQNLSNNTTNTIGRGESGYHSGSIGSLRMWNTALTSAQVLQNYNAVKSKYGL